MPTELIINATLPETRIALLEDDEIQELHIERDSERGIVGNIYKGKVLRVLPGMQAAFVDIGLEKAAFLYVDDIFFPEMDEPLVSPPLPENLHADDREPEASSEAAVVEDADGQPVMPPQGHQGGGGHSRDNRDRGRGGRRGRHGRSGGGRHGRGGGRNQTNVFQPKGPVKPGLPGAPGTPPGSPEDHAKLQAEYARLMLNTDDSDEVIEQAPQTERAESELPPIAASAEEEAVSEQPVARSPIPEENSEGTDSAALSGEPEIDAQAWEDDMPASQSEQVASTTDAEDGAVGAEVADAASAEPAVAPLVNPIDEDDDEDDRPKNNKDKDDDDSEVPRRRRRREPVNIADIIKEGQEVIVQVAKDPIGTKGARLTCHVSLPGRYLVFMPTVDHVGVSRRIESDGDRRRLKETISAIRPPKTGVIVRTASGKQTDQKLKNDLDYLVETWNEIQQKFQKQRSPSVVYQDLTIVLRAIRDMFTDEVDKVVVDSKREHSSIMRFVTKFVPHVKDKIELYTGDMPIFDAYGIEPEIAKALERKVWLKSGGYLVVDQAEALVAIDVNTGRYVGKKTLEETILKTNLEAVKEIAYQLRLRNAGGIIILDLIDMEKDANKEKVYKALEEALKKDRARPSILKISQLGLVEMTRKRTRDSMVRSLCEPCTYCEGRGYVKNRMTIAYDVMRDIEREAADRDTQGISIQCHPSVADVLLEEKRDVIEDMEHQYNKRIAIRSNGAYHVEQYELVAHRGDAKTLTWTSDERRAMVRQKIQERAHQVAAENRRKTEAERAQRRVEQEERRKQLDIERAERAAKRAVLLERKRAILDERQKAANEKRAALEAQGIDLNALAPEEQQALQIPEDITWVEVASALGDDPLAAEALAMAQQPQHHRGMGGGGAGGPRFEGPGGERGRGRRRNRGRRGRGGRGGGRGDGRGGPPRQARPEGQGSHGGGNPDQGGEGRSSQPAAYADDFGGGAQDGSSDPGNLRTDGTALPNSGGEGAPQRKFDPRKRRRGRRGGRRGGRGEFRGPRPDGQAGPGGPPQGGGMDRPGRNEPSERMEYVSKPSAPGPQGDGGNNGE